MIGKAANNCNSGDASSTLIILSNVLSNRASKRIGCVSVSFNQSLGRNASRLLIALPFLMDKMLMKGRMGVKKTGLTICKIMRE